MILSKKQRQEIIDDFVSNHDGKFDARMFRDEVRRVGSNHPAWRWFEWDETKAADDHQVWQARTFVRDLVIRFSVETTHRGKMTVEVVEAPRVFSPLVTRSDGGGYVLTDPDDPYNMGMLCAEAASKLEEFLTRYNGVMMYAKISVRTFLELKGILQVLRAKAEEDEA